MSHVAIIVLPDDGEVILDALAACIEAHPDNVDWMRVYQVVGPQVITPDDDPSPVAQFVVEWMTRHQARGTA